MPQALAMYCSASEVRHPSEVRHLHFMTILKSFYCPVTAYMYIPCHWKKLFHLVKCKYCLSLGVFTAGDELHWDDEIHWPTSRVMCFLFLSDTRCITNVNKNCYVFGDFTS